MTEPDGLEARVSALESEVRELSVRVRGSEQDAAAARVLAGGADRDVAQMRDEIRDFRHATTSSFTAMREDIVDLRSHVDRGFAEINGRFGEISHEFAKVDRGFAGVRGTLDATAAGQEQIVRLLTTLIDRDGGAS